MGIDTRRLRIAAFALATLLPGLAVAETRLVFNGVPMNGAAGGGKLAVNNDQKLMFDAVRKVVNRDWRGAEQIYDEVIARNGGNIDAYLQRGIVRRELHNDAGTMEDANAVVTLANNALPTNPNNANLYYQRGMGFRLLKNFPRAKEDIQKAIQISGQSSWRTDLQATELEEKESR